MKKLFTLLLVLAGYVSTASAWADMYLKNNLSGWGDAGYQFTGSNDGVQDVYELTLTPEIVALANGGDIYFRPNHYTEHGQRNPSDGNNFTFTFTDNGQNQTYGPTGKGENGAFVIPHSSIKANSYKITVYYKYNDGNKFYIKVEIVDLPVTISDPKGYATFSCNRALNFENTGINAYIATGQGDNSITLSKVTTIAANQGMFLSGSTANVPVITSIDAPATNYLKAGDEKEHVTSTSGETTTHCFIFANGAEGYGFYNLSSARTIPTGKAYLEYTSAAGSSRSFIGFDLEGAATGINTITSNTPISENFVFYNISGQRVQSPTKGLYIVNGKKIVIK